jgi:Response regulators consisting of a CheY-like receiver domain and a winged-helix DNA-binding domain
VRGLNILIVDDEKMLVKGLKNSLTQEGYTVFAAYDGKEALNCIRHEKIDFIILDLMLPEMDGMTLCRRIRQVLDTPIIMLTAKDDPVDKILGLELGADDYVTKPFHTRELIARIKSIKRRVDGAPKGQDFLECGELILNKPERSLYRAAQEIPLTAKEFDILEILMSNRGMVFSRDKLFEMVWNELGCDTRTVDVHISNLRDKIEEDPSNPRYILTRWGVGYFFRKDRGVNSETIL